MPYLQVTTLVIEESLPSQLHAEDEEAKQLCQSSAEDIETEIHLKSVSQVGDIYDERRGFVGLVNPTTDKLDVVSKFRVAKGSGPYWAHMHIHDGILYLRHGEYFAAYKIK